MASKQNEALSKVINQHVPVIHGTCSMFVIRGRYFEVGSGSEGDSGGKGDDSTDNDRVPIDVYGQIDDKVKNPW